MSAISKVAQGFQGSAEAGAQANAASYNAANARTQANIVGMTSASQEEASRRQTAADIGSIAAEQGGANIGTGGSAADVIRSSEINAQMDALNIRYEGQLQKRGLFTEAQGYDYAAQVLRQRAANAKLGGFLGAGTSLLGGTSDYTAQTGQLPFQSMFR